MGTRAPKKYLIEKRQRRENCTNLVVDWAAAIVRQKNGALLFGRLLRDPHLRFKRFSVDMLVER
jgi:hypothetical protein